MAWTNPQPISQGDAARYPDDENGVFVFHNVERFFDRPMNTGNAIAVLMATPRDARVDQIVCTVGDPTTTAAYLDEPTVQIGALAWLENEDPELSGPDPEQESGFVGLHAPISLVEATAYVPQTVAVDADVGLLAAGTPLAVEATGVLGDNGKASVTVAVGDGTTTAVLLWSNPDGGGQDNAWFVTGLEFVTGGAGTVAAGDWTAGELDVVKATYGVAPVFETNSVLEGAVALDDDESSLVVDTVDFANRLIGDQVLWAVFDSPDIEAGTPITLRLELQNTQGPRNITVQVTLKYRAEQRAG